VRSAHETAHAVVHDRPRVAPRFCRGIVMSARSVYGYSRRAVAQSTMRRERAVGVGGDDPAALWLALSPSEKEAFAGTVGSADALAAWVAERRRTKRERRS
jgi:hypothetical protein